MGDCQGDPQGGIVIEIVNMGDTDIVWTKKPTHEPTTLITFYQGEQGFASFVAGMGLIGDEEPVAKIFSKLHSVDPMNTFPDPTFPEWRVYERRNDDGRRYFILRLSHTYIVGANMTKAWLYNYPVFRDITMHLSSYGVDESLYLTSHLMGGYPAAEQAYVPDDQLVVFDYLNPEEDAYLTDGSRIEEDMLIAPPCWMFANIFGNFNHNVIKGNWVAICSHDENVFVNERGCDMLINFISDVHSLGVNHAKVGEIYEMITQVEHMGETTDLKTLLDGGFYA